MREVRRTAIIDKDGNDILLSVVESSTNPGTYGLVVLNPDGSGLSGGGTPAGNDGEIQYNDSGAFGASSNLFRDIINGRLGIGNNTPQAPLEVTGEARLTSTTDMGSNNESLTTKKYVDDGLDTKVGLTGDETIAGIKTFSSFPITPSSAPTTDYQVANKKYVDDNAGGTSYWDLTGSDIEHNNAGNVISANATGWGLLNEVVSSTNPVIVPNNNNDNTGLGWAGTNQMSLIAGGGEMGRVTTNGIISSQANGWGLLNEAVSSSNPVVVPNNNDVDTGLGWAGNNILSLAAGGQATAYVYNNGFVCIDNLTVGTLSPSTLGVIFSQGNGSKPQIYVNVPGEMNFTWTANRNTSLNRNTMLEVISGVDARQVQAFLTAPDQNKLRHIWYNDFNGGNETVGLCLDRDNGVGIFTDTPLSALHINTTPGDITDGISLGDGDTGVYESSDDVLDTDVGGSQVHRHALSGSVVYSQNYGGIVKPLATKTNDYTITRGDYTILADGTSNTVDITLPDATTMTGQIFNIKAIDTTNTVTLDTTSSQTIDGSTSLVIGLNNTVTVQSDGSNWVII